LGSRKRTCVVAKRIYGHKIWYLVVSSLVLLFILLICIHSWYELADIFLVDPKALHDDIYLVKLIRLCSLQISQFWSPWGSFTAKSEGERHSETKNMHKQWPLYDIIIVKNNNSKVFISRPLGSFHESFFFSHSAPARLYLLL